MANPRPGQKGFSGPVGEGWGRPLQNFVDWANKSASDTQRSVDQHIRNAAGIPGDIVKNVTSFRGPKMPWDNSDKKAVSRLANRSGQGPNVGKGAGTAASRAASAKAKAAAARGTAARQKAQAAQRNDRNKMAAARGTAPPSKPSPKGPAPKTGRNARTKAVGRAAAKVQARNSGLTASQARAKARQIVKKRSK